MRQGPGRNGKRYASLGDIIVVSVKSATPTAGVKKGDVMQAVVVRTTKEVKRKDGSAIRFGDNAVVHQQRRNPKAPASSDLWPANCARSNS